MKPTVPQPPFLYEDFEQALGGLKTALVRAPAYALLLGESGSGKTTLLRTLAAKLDRRRFHIRFKGMPFVVNVDVITQPAHDGLYVEIKSRTWSARDAVRKAQLIGEILDLFGITDEQIVRRDYIDLT